MTADAAPALAMRGISKRFGRTTALDRVDFTVRSGTVHALLGENGAGKTTLMRIAFGLVRPTEGTIERHGAAAVFRSPRDAIAQGIAMVQQHFSLVPQMTVAENVALGHHGPYESGSIRARVKAVAETTGWALDADARVGDLSVGAQQRVEILKSLERHASLLILDEPTAILAPAETRELLLRLREFAAQGRAVVLITHKLRDALDAADDVTVLRHGQTVLTSPAASLGEAELVRAMIGTARATDRVRATRTPGAAVISLQGASFIDPSGVMRLRDATLTIREGEIVGVAGVERSGCQELLRLAAGRLTPTSGTVERPAVVGFVPEDRHRDAIALDMSIAENVTLSNAAQRRGTLRWRDAEASADALIHRYDIVAGGPRAGVATLSGGNQQKLVVAREMTVGRVAVVAENPTRGLDVNSADAVRARLQEARDHGAAILVFSSDIDELLQVADRCVACFAGHVFEVAVDREAIGRAILGATDE